MRPPRDHLLLSSAAASPPSATQVNRDDPDALPPAASSHLTTSVDRDDPNALLPPPAAARRLNVATQTLARWRMEQRGPPFYLVGGRVAYRWSEVEAWLAERRFAGTGETDAD
jgi:hypothetical protein